MNPRLLVLLVLPTLAAAASATAQGRPTTPEPPPAAASAVASAGLDYFAGSWIVSAKDPNTGEVTKIPYRVEPTLGGAWLTGFAESAELGFRASDMWGRDSRTGEIMRLIFDDRGVYSIIRSPGWDGDTLVLEGDAHSQGGAVRVRETIRRIGAKEFEAVWEARREGRWTPYSIERVIRA